MARLYFLFTGNHLRTLNSSRATTNFLHHDSLLLFIKFEAKIVLF